MVGLHDKLVILIHSKFGKQYGWVLSHFICGVRAYLNKRDNELLEVFATLRDTANKSR